MTKEVRTIEWNVYNFNITHKSITIFNVFRHTAFKRSVYHLLEKCDNKTDFSEKVRKEAFYFFGSRAEYEVVISAWVGGDGTEQQKVDVYSQLSMNWERFIDYLWDFK